jgi:hypothetical protein
MSECLNCGKTIKNKYCNVSCQNSYTGKSNEVEYYKNPILCKYCGKIIVFSKRKNLFCDHKCSASHNNIGIARNKTVKIPKIRRTLIKDNSKEEIFILSKNWQSARSTIRKEAVRIYKESDKECKCAICGYDTHIEIAHRKAVSDFESSAMLIEINHIDNLIALCPNHHWEYDHGVITI